MLSICIPVYNFDVTELVDELHQQATELRYPFEILIFDDRSHSYFRKRNSTLACKSQVSYLDFDYNIGRSKIRNRLADYASGQWILFLDCDVVIDDPQFIKRYIDSLNQAPVVCGGIKYGKRPIREELLLRWKYGVKREMKSVSKRQQAPYSSFMSGNFLIDYDVFHQIRFNEELSGYGHEDTLFGIELKKLKTPILHIENPSVHIGLDTSKDFLSKSEQGVINLTRILFIMPELRRDIEKSVKILRVFRMLRSIGMIYPLRWVFRVVNPIIKLRLLSNKPSLILFDLYKLALLSKLYSKGWKISLPKFR